MASTWLGSARRRCAFASFLACAVALAGCYDTNPQKRAWPAAPTIPTEVVETAEDSTPAAPPDAGADAAVDEPAPDASAPREPRKPEQPSGDPDDAGVTEPVPQGPCTGSEVVRSQAYLDAFFKGCKYIGDTVYIDANTVDNLDALSEVEEIAGELVIAPGVTFPLGDRVADTSKVRLRDLTGLSKLKRVRELILRQLPITSLKGLEQLRWKGLTLDDLPALRSLEGLAEGGEWSELTLSRLRIEDLTGLRAKPLQTLKIDALPALRSLAGAMVEGTPSLQIANVPVLRTLAGWGAGVSSLVIADAPVLADLAAARGSSSLHRLELTNLPALASLDDVSGAKQLSWLQIDKCDGLRDLSGLEYVDYMGVIWIESSANIRTLRGLGGLKEVSDGGIVLRNLPALESLEGFEGLGQVNAITLDNLPKLQDLTHLDSLRLLDHLGIYGESAMKTLHGLEQLSSMSSLGLTRTSIERLDGLGGQLYVLELKDNPRLQSLGALSGVMPLMVVMIEGNPMLANLSGLDHLTLLPELRLVDNGSLQSLRALSAITGAGVHQPVIEGNTQLAQCEIRWLAERAHFAPVNLESNGPVGTCAP